METFEEEEMKGFIPDNENELTHSQSTTSIPTQTQSTKNMSKSARNRYYAQTSRARHRAYVNNLEKDRELLLERLEAIEAENRRMREELTELKTKRVKLDSSVAPLNPSSSPFISSSVSNPIPFLDTQYALSVLDLSLHDSLKQNQLTLVTNSPWLNNNKFIVPLLFLVAFAEGLGWRDPMSWKGSYCKLTRTNRRNQNELRRTSGKGKAKVNSVCTLMKCLKTTNQNRNKKEYSRNLLLLKLRELRTYLQQFGK